METRRYNDCCRTPRVFLTKLVQGFIDDLFAGFFQDVCSTFLAVTMTSHRDNKKAKGDKTGEVKHTLDIHGVYKSLSPEMRCARSYFKRLIKRNGFFCWQQRFLFSWAHYYF